MGLKKKIAALLVACTLALAAPALATINFPGVLDDDTTLFNLKNGDVYIAQFHNNPKDALKAVEAKVGVDSSNVTSSLDYLLKNSASVNPGHKHTGSSINFSDGSASSPGLVFGYPVTDTNTGVFHPGTGIIAFASGGGEVFRYTATGLGVKVTSVNFPIDVAGTVRLQTNSSLCFGGTGAADNDTCMQRSGAHTLKFLGGNVSVDQATTDVSEELQGIAAKTGAFLNVRLLPADANPSFRIAADGVTLGWGAGGASAIDTTLTRSGANALTTAGAFTVSGALTGSAAVTFNGSAAAINIGTGASTPTVVLGNSSGGSVTIGGASSATWVWAQSSGLLTVGEAANMAFGTTTGTKIGTATSQKIGFFNATPIIQPVASTALVTALQNLGLIASGTFSGNIVTTGTLAVGTSGATVTRILSGSVSQTITAQVAPVCTDGAPFAVTNAADGDECVVGSLAAGYVANTALTCRVSSAGNVTIRSCCLVGTCTTGATTYRVFLFQ